jgi:hypothetical protein
MRKKRTENKDKKAVVRINTEEVPGNVQRAAD